MRKIYKDTAKTNALFNQDDNRATKQDIVDLSNQIAEVDGKVDTVASELTSLEQNLEDSINTEAITAETANIGDITADTVSSTSISATNATISNKVTSKEVEADKLTANVKVDTPKVDAVSVEATNVSATNITGDEATVGEANITTANIDTANVSTLNVADYNTTSITTSGDLSVGGSATIPHATINEIESDSIGADEAEFDVVSSVEELVENIVWNGEQSLVNLADFFISVPHFENGQYYLQIIDNTVPILTIEIFNSVDNYFVRWSQLTAGNLLKIYKIGTGSGSNLMFEVDSTTGHALKLKYATTSATANVSAPTEYVNAPEDYEVEYSVQYKDGSKFFKNVDLASQGGTVGILKVTETDDWENTTEEYQYDTTESINALRYKPDQSLNKADDVEFNEVSTVFLNVRDFSTRNMVTSELETPLTLDFTKYDDGAVLILRNSSTAAEPQPSTAYIKRTIDGTVHLLPIAALNGVSSQTNIPLIWDATTHSLKEANNLVVPNDLTVTNDATIGNDLSVTGDASVTGKLEVADEATFSDKLIAEDDMYVAGDLFVKGTTHTTGVEDITATSDTITLRANNNTALQTGQVSGVVINKYNGTDDLALVAANDGTMRIGTGVGTDTTYNKIALKAADGKYYNYDDTDPDDIQYTLMNPQPSGTMTAWTNKTTKVGYTLYATATFTVIDKTSLIPLLGRDEASNFSDKQLLQWDATGVKATGVTPAENGKFLKATVNAGADYHWSAITFSATGYASMLYAFPTLDDTVFMDLELKQGTKPTPVPSQATTVSHTYNDFLYYTETDKVVYFDSSALEFYEVFFNIDGTCTVDTTPTICGDPTKLVACTIYSEKIDNVNGTSYQWAEAGGKGVSFKGTRAQYEVAKLIPMGSEGYIPDGTLIIITDEDDYITGESR